MNAQKSLLAPYTDKRFSGNMDLMDSYPSHSTRKNNQRIMPVQNMPWRRKLVEKRDKDGKEQIFKLVRGITREQIGNKESKLFKLVQDMIIGIPMIKAIHDWSYKTVIH